MLVAQGTIQLKQDERGQTRVVINPICDYKVNHNGKNYTVFVSDDKNYLMLPSEQPFAVHDLMREVLVQSAIAQVKIEIEIAVYDKDSKGKAASKEYKITGLRVPAMPVSR